uniref:Tyrosine-protein kinase receptor n=4 Tax=cellular organisms TaxID=131567 RepID=M1VPF6_HUMAN|nr:CD74-ROS1_C6;R32 fusion protein [Homo sapiens]
MHRRRSRSCREDQKPVMDDQRDLISNNEQLPMLGRRPGAPESKCSRGALYTGFSILVTLLLAGQATTAYFLYQQQGRLDKLTVTSQNLQLENLRMKLPKPPKPVSKMRMATPLLMQALPMGALPQGPMQNATKYGNMTEDHVMHLLQNADPLKVYPPLKGSFPENLRHLKNTMETIDWKVFESWMHHWLLFEMSRHSLEQKPTDAPPKAGVPNKPGIPKLLEGSKNSIQWEKAEDNGCRITYYILEIRKSTSNNLQNQNLRWKMTFNGSCSSVCTWKSKNLKGIFQFRVVAANNLGFGEYSGISENIILVGDDFWIPETSFILTIIVGIFLVVTIPLTFVWHRRLKNQKSAKEGVTVLINEDKELAELRGLAAGVGLANACYAIHTLPTQEEIENLPAFPREKLTLRLLLGSGAFGEVYEGTAVDILGVGSGEIKVAVKTLKKGSTDQEKIEFLKEAHLMSKFNHPNILKQLGVCLLNEPQYIILELMEGGDLLTYLRKARMATFYGPLLTLVDLVDLCVDISKGCVYLERMHFIHRDLAARNCLVSVKDYTSPRIVKIGDFGLARDIYKNDYYRKRGEGLLPVRWMAPESLMDGIFTTQSDVWSFGILIWEILTLGHQPYPAHSNLDVLNYVQTGGRLEPPRNCPDDLWNLMTQCWAQEPDQRPTFHRIQDQLQLFRNFFLNSIYKSRDEANNSGVINESFEGEDGDVICLNSDDIMPVALMETKNREGLNYMVLATECGQGEEKSEGPLGSQESESCGLRKEEKEPHADKDFCQEKQVAYCPSGKPEGLNYACLTHSGYGDGSD